MYTLFVVLLFDRELTSLRRKGKKSKKKKKERHTRPNDLTEILWSKPFDVR